MTDLRKKQNKIKLNSECLSFKKPMHYDRFEWLYVNRSMLKIDHGY